MRRLIAGDDDYAWDLNRDESEYSTEQRICCRLPCIGILEYFHRYPPGCLFLIRGIRKKANTELGPDLDVFFPRLEGQ